MPGCRPPREGSILIDLRAMIHALCDAGVEFIIVGGVAGNIHGAARATFDADIVYRRTPENLRRTANALQPFQPRLRGAPDGLPFRLDVPTLERGLNFTLITSLGSLDLIGEIAGGGNYDELLPDTSLTSLFEQSCRVLNLDKLIEVKRAAGRPKDFDAIAELELIRDRIPPPGRSAS